MATTFIARGAAAYDAYMGRWSRRLAPLFIDFAGVADNERLLDVGCGTGVLTFALAAAAEIAAIVSIDQEASFVDGLRAQNTNERITAQQGDACALAFPDNTFDRALSMLVLHFVPSPNLALTEMRRVVRPGGIVAATVWDTFGGMPSQRMFWDTIVAIEPSAAERRAASLIRPTTQPGALQAAFMEAGFQSVTEALLTIRMDFSNFDDYWHPLLNGQGTLPEFLGSFPQDRRQLIKETVRAAYLCNQSDGPRSFASTAWAVRGVVPQA